MIFKIKIFVIFIFVLEIISNNVSFGQEGIDIWTIKKEELGKNFFYESSETNVDDKLSNNQTSEDDGFFYDKKKYEELHSLSDLSIMLSDRIGREATRRFFYKLKESKGFSLNNIKTIIARYDAMFGKNNTNKLLSHGDTGFYMDDYTSIILFFNGLKNFYSYYGGENYELPLDRIIEIIFNNFYWIVFNNSKRFSSGGMGSAGMKDFIYKFDLLKKEKVLTINFLDSLSVKDFFYFLDLRYVEFSFLIEQLKSMIKDFAKVSLIIENLDWEKVFNIFYKIRIQGIYFKVYEENPYTSHSLVSMSDWEGSVQVGFKNKKVHYWTDLFLGTESTMYGSQRFNDFIVKQVREYIRNEYERIRSSQIKAMNVVCSELFKYL